MSVIPFSNKDISTIGNYAESINLGEAVQVSEKIAFQNNTAFNLRNSTQKNEFSFQYIADAKLQEGSCITRLIEGVMVNSFIGKEANATDDLISRIFTNSIAIEFGEQIFHSCIGKRCRVSHCYNTICYIVEEKSKGYRIATYDDEVKGFRLFNALKTTVTIIDCNPISLQQVSTLMYKIEKPILCAKSLITDNKTLVAYQNLPSNSFTIEFKDQLSDSMIRALGSFNAKKLKNNAWQVSENIITLLRELTPIGRVTI